MRRYTEVRNDKKAMPLRSATMGIDMPSWSINELGNNQYLTGDAATRLFDLEDILCAPDGTERIALDRLREICQAEREGKLVVLPCKAGERWMRDGKQYIVAEISITESCGTMVRHYEDGNGEMLSCNPQYFAKHYTRAEAEAALKGAEHDRV